MRWHNLGRLTLFLNKPSVNENGDLPAPQRGRQARTDNEDEFPPRRPLSSPLS